MSHSLYRLHELAFRTQYGELKERTRAAGGLLPGTPGSLALRTGSGRGYWYRVFYSVPRKVTETLVAKEGDEATLEVYGRKSGLRNGPPIKCLLCASWSFRWPTS